MKLLDDFIKIGEIDRSGMLKVVEQFPEQCRDAIALAETVDVDRISLTNPSSIAVLGMGGSGIGGNLLKTILQQEISVPVHVIKGYELPHHVGKNTLVFAVSYSGNTEETISTFSQALERGSSIVAVTSGGLLAKISDENNIVVIRIPTGYQPRAALGYLFFPLFVVLGKLSIIHWQENRISEALRVLENQRKRLSSNSAIDENSAKQLAMELKGKIPIIYGSDSLMAPAALRWKCQFNENSKVQAFWNFFPELNHNEIVGWELLKDITQKFSLIILRNKSEHPQITKRVEITKELISNHLGSIYEVWGEGESKFSQVLSVLYQGDFVSVYLALLNEIDPTPVKRIELLKKRLAEQ